ncbi:MAG: hypothetical protein WBA66_15905 [Xanthobacteraceae bacterium]
MRPGNSKVKRTKVGCSEARTRTGFFFFVSSTTRSWRSAASAARPLGQFAHHLLRQRRRRPGPAFGQQVDEDALAGGHGVDLDLACQRQADRHAVRVTPRRADIIGHRRAELVDGDVNGLFEADDQNGAGHHDIGADIVGERQHQPRVTVRGGKLRRALDRLGHRRADEGKHRKTADKKTTGKAPRAPAQPRPADGKPLPHRCTVVSVDITGGAPPTLRL